jgi:uroporphyrinogen-III decarboxylase
MVLDAAQRVRDSVEARYCAYTSMARRPTVRVAASGPTSIASRLIDPQELLIGLLAGDPAVDRLLEICTDVGEQWLSTIRAAGLDAVIIDSVASPPLVGPRLYADKVFPLHRQLMAGLDAAGQAERPLVMGGDTSDVIALVAATGANVLLADHPADTRSFVTALRTRCSAGRLAGLRIRRNIDPAHCVVPVDDEAVRRYVRDFEAIIEAGLSVTIGTGILDYHQDPSAVRVVAARVMEALAASRR